MEQIQIIITTASAAIGLLITTLTFLSKFVKNAKAKKLLENAIELGEKIQPYIAEAEQFAHYTGAEKKAFVLMHAEQIAKENKLDYNVSDVAKNIDELVKLTRQVNAKKEEQTL